MAASSDNLIASIDPFFIRHSFSDYFWPSHSDNDSLSKSIYDDHDFNNVLLPQQQSDHHHNQYLNHQQQSDFEQKQYKPTTTQSLTPSSDLEASATPKRRTTTSSVNGKIRITKRKSRATKKNQTTFITADPSNFRQMVQQVTGIRFDSTTSTLPPLLSHYVKPEIHRPIGRYTSSFFSDQSQSLISDRSIYGGGGLNSVNTFAGQSGNVIESSYGASTDGFACFPTLESWKVM